MLGPLDIAILDLEERMPRHTGAKDRAIRAELGTGPARYYQHLDQLIERPDVIAAHPMLVNRLTRIRAERAADRSRRILGR